MDEQNVEQTAAEEKPAENLEAATEEKPAAPVTEKPAEEKPDHEDGEAGDTDGAHVPIREVVDTGELASNQGEKQEVGQQAPSQNQQYAGAVEQTAQEPEKVGQPDTIESEIAHIFKRAHADLGARVDAIEKAFSDRVEAIEKDFADYRQKLHDAGIRLVS